MIGRKTSDARNYIIFMSPFSIAYKIIMSCFLSVWTRSLSCFSCLNYTIANAKATPQGLQGVVISTATVNVSQLVKIPRQKKCAPLRYRQDVVHKPDIAMDEFNTPANVLVV